jgi:hypothetical protein
MDEGWLIGWFCNAIMAGYHHAPSPPSGRIKMNEKPFVVRVGDVVEHEDGGATYSFDLDDDSAEGLAKIGLEFVLYCAAYDLDLQYVLDNLKRLKDAT